MIGLQTLEKLTNKTIALIGDLILDRYTYGSTFRVSPEAPVPVLSITKQEMKAGGAGNVALNLRSLGMNVRLMSRLGCDQAGDDVLGLLKAEDIDCSSVLCDDTYMTSAKTRFIASSQQLLRVDQEVTSKLSPEQERLFLDTLNSFLSGVDLVAISDYAKGLLTNELLSAIISKARAKGIFVIVDPKGADFMKYRGASLIKPNFMEAINAVPPSDRVLEKAAPWIAKNADIGHVMVTKSEQGIFLYTAKEGLRHFPVVQREVRDSTGAGDTVLATLASSLASGLSLDESIHLANLSGSIVVERVGCAAISKEDLAKRLLDHNPTGKILSLSAFLAAASVFSTCTTRFFVLPSSRDVSLDMLKRLRRKAKEPSSATVKVVLFEDNNPEEHTLEIVSGMEPIHWVVYGADQSYIAKLGTESLVDLRGNT